jgi:hypothetical protein
LRENVFLWALSLSFGTALHAQLTAVELIPQTAAINVNAASVASETILRTIFRMFLLRTVATADISTERSTFAKEQGRHKGALIDFSKIGSCWKLWPECDSAG